jgi:beta-phosphoglucomutase-like phosphatase (HAD superfamily)
MPKVEAVVFDMDGVLIDSELVWQQVREEFATDCGAVWDAAVQTSTMGCNTAMGARVMVERLAMLCRLGP